MEYPHWGYSILSNSMDIDDINFFNVKSKVILSRHNDFKTKRNYYQIDKFISFNFNR